MKQFIALLLLLTIWLTWMWLYDTYIAKKYTSWYNGKKSSSWVEIKTVQLDKDQINRLSKTIKDLKKDPIFTLKVSDFMTKEWQPLIKEKYDALYDKVLKQQQQSNRPVN